MKDETQRSPEGPAKAPDAFDALVEDINSPLFTVKLESGRSIRTSNIHVQNTYWRLLEGIPMEETLSWTKDNLLEDSRRIFGAFPLHILPAKIRRAEKRLPDWPIEFSRIAAYPPVQVAAFFVSSPIDKKMHLSGLVVAWHQDSLEGIPDPEVEQQLKALPWDRLALDFEI